MELTDWELEDWIELILLMRMREGKLPGLSIGNAGSSANECFNVAWIKLPP